ncbi:SusC/RagA family TonB-linked outer membrane protein [Niastella vici]|nr:TonB-dependent receptor [Niastella vici]
MKFTAIFMFVACLHVSANVHAQKITLQEKNTPLSNVFRQIKKQTGFVFWYEDNLFDGKRKVNIDVKDASIETVLNLLLKNDDLTYEIINKTVVLKRRPVVTAVPAKIVEQKPVAKPVKGRVTDEDGKPLEGVSVSIKGTSIGTTTRANGEFELEIPDNSGNVLLFSFVGRLSVEVNISGKSFIKVQLMNAGEQQEQVTIIAYGSQRKSLVTAAASSVKGGELVRTQSADLGSALQGMAAGVTVTSPTGAPGTEAVVRIRGIGTLNNNNPLYIIDGIPVNSGLTTISPSDIESVEILKDASAASIYGARAANGVILVTTKSGAAGKNMINIDASLGIAAVSHEPKMVNTSQYIQLQNEAFANDGNSNRNTDDPAKLPNTNWQDVIYRQGITQKYNASFSGGNDKTRYYISGNTVDQKGIIVNSYFKRYGIRTNVVSDVKSWFRIGENINITFDRNQSVGASGDGGRAGSLPGVVRYALIRPNAIPVYDPATGLLSDLPPASLYKNPNLYGDGKNPLAIALYRNNTLNRYRLVGDVFAEAKLLKGLKLRTDFGLDYYTNEQQTYTGQIPGDRTTLTDLNRSVDKFRNRFNTLNWTNVLTYSRNIKDDHDVNITAGTEYVAYTADYLSASRNGYDARSDNNGDLQYLVYGTGQQFADGVKQQWALMSYFGRASYAFQGKYLATASLRSDASSRFSEKNRRGYFPSFSLGWNVARESFMKSITWMNDLKIRGSWGRLGNQEIGFYPFSTIYSTTNNVLQVVSKGNPDVKWESTEQTNIGFDAAILNRRVKVSVDYYIKNTSDILIQLPVSFTNGDAAPPYVNGAGMRNRGLDVTVNYSQAHNDWNWNVTGNVTTVNNQVTSLYKSKEQLISAGNGLILLKEGESVSSFYGYKTAGIFQNQNEIDSYKDKNGNLIQPNAKPGDIKFADINNDGVLDDKDRSIIGHGLPKFLYSINGTVAYKHFDLNVFVNGVSGNQIYNEVDNIINSFDSRGFNTKLDFYNNRWHGEGTSNKIPRATYLDGNNNRRTSDRYIESGAYVRLKNVVLGYNFSQKKLQTIGITNARLFVSAQNLATITRYKGADPELYTNDNLANYGDLGIGIDMGTYPPARSFTVGIQLNF